MGRDGAPLNPSALDLIDVTGSAGFVGNPSLTDGSLDVYDEPDRQRRAVATGPPYSRCLPRPRQGVRAAVGEGRGSGHEARLRRLPPR
ncbi:hypothetical protein GCM10010400_51620 [Streptomyces aculeolatus]|uniref:hypothetical protein n=1 Tax=Streptomyces aculeolatus TaxID=270689 RepID=UPI001CEDD231|nr:hypothetical protein [Streptomyces aculeolatus]